MQAQSFPSLIPPAINPAGHLLSHAPASALRRTQAGMLGLKALAHMQTRARMLANQRRSMTVWTFT